MNYELCKELKDAGFPQDGINQFIDTKLSSPTLSELIMCCGEDIRDLLLHTQHTRKLAEPWEAIPNKKRRPECKSKKGSTPEIAVARLWLELNKKHG